MKTCAIVAPHFPPSNLAGVHRARLLSQHLEEFGWHPVILTTHWRYYEEALDWDLHRLLDPRLEIVHTSALPVRPVRIIGDIGIRGIAWHLSALRKLRRNKKMDFLLITVPSFYSALLGQLMFREAPLPFGIDYIDPWVHIWPEAEVRYSKAWISMKLGELLEPWAVRNASLISGVATGYFQGVLARNPHLEEQAVTAAMPYGFSEYDYTAPVLSTRRPHMFDPDDGGINLVYAGALLPKAHIVLERLLSGVRQLTLDSPEIADRLKIHFIGTGRSPTDPNGYNILPVAERLQVLKFVQEHPARMGYLDVLVHLRNASGIIIIGSSEAHYTPSKVYQAVQARRPVLALLHEASTAVRVLRESGAGSALTLTEDQLPPPAAIASALKSFILTPYNPDQVDWTAFQVFSARESARMLASAMDEARQRFTSRTRNNTPTR